MTAPLALGETRKQLRLEIVTWIERTYHRRRRQRTLGKLTPIEFETIEVARAAVKEVLEALLAAAEIRLLRPTKLIEFH